MGRTVTKSERSGKRDAVSKLAEHRLSGIGEKPVGIPLSVSLDIQYGVFKK